MKSTNRSSKASCKPFPFPLRKTCAATGFGAVKFALIRANNMPARASGELGKRKAADLAVPDGGPVKLARVAAADAVSRAPAPTSVEADGKQCLHEVVWPADWDGPASAQPPKRKEVRMRNFYI